MDSFFNELRIWLLSLLVPDRWEAAASLTARFHVDLAMVFLGFYGMLTILCLFVLVLGARFRGISRGMACACVMLMIVAAGAVAGLSVISARMDEGNREAAVKQMREQYLALKNRKAVPPIQPKSISPAEEPLERIQSMKPVERREMDALERHRQWHRTHDDEGYLIEDDYSHEDSYPKAGTEYGAR